MPCLTQDCPSNRQGCGNLERCINTFLSASAESSLSVMENMICAFKIQKKKIWKTSQL